MQFSGRGKYFFANGDRYEGEFDNGERDGFGIIFYASGGRRSGVWSQDKLVGEVSSRSMENTGLFKPSFRGGVSKARMAKLAKRLKSFSFY